MYDYAVQQREKQLTMNEYTYQQQSDVIDDSG